jgi:hypothetical protein
VVKTEDGTKHIVNTNDLMAAQQALGEKTKFNSRKAKSKEKISDVFGDFFDLGANPPGCMAKGAPTVNFKGEKEKLIQMLREEAKTYDINSIEIELHKKMDKISVDIQKQEKQIIGEEDKQLRNLDRLKYMSEYLQEDNTKTKQSLQNAQTIRDQSKTETQQIMVQNKA